MDKPNQIGAFREDLLKAFGLALPLATSLLLALSPVTAEAHGPTRQKVTKSVEIAAPPDAVWNLIKNFGDMSWHPVVEKTTADGGNDPANKPTRVLFLKGGGEIHEELRKYEDAAMSYSYKINEVNIDVLPVANYTSTIDVEPGKNGGSVVEWRGAFYRGYMNNDPPAKYNDEAAVKAVSGVYEAGLTNLMTLAEKK
jgi:carbon monoxide dehydrogenase subunit G